MRRRVNALLTIFLLLGFCRSVCAKVASLTSEDFKIDKLYLGQQIDEVVGFYGKPEKVGQTLVYKDKKNADQWRRYYFDGIELEVSGNSGKVYDMAVTRAGMKTPRGIGVGCKMNEVLGKYGKTSLYGKSLVYQFYDDSIESTYVMEFVIANSKVSQIDLYFAWD